MDTSLFNRLQATLLAVATVGLFLLAACNLVEERQFQQPDDGVWWREAPGGLSQRRCCPTAPASVPAFRQHDLLTAATVLPGHSHPAYGFRTNLLPGVKPLPEGSPGGAAGGTAFRPRICFPRPTHSDRAGFRPGAYSLPDPSLWQRELFNHPRRRFAGARVIPEPLDRSLVMGLRIIGLIYLAIGIYVLFRRWTAPRATHFYLFCLVSFALYVLKFTGKLDQLDWTVFLSA